MRLIDAEQYAKRIYEHINAIEVCPSRSTIEKNKEQQQWKDALYDLVQMPIVNPYEWISVKDRLPDIDELCLLSMENRITKYRWVVIGYFHTNCDEYVTHWMPLPAPPTENL